MSDNEPVGQFIFACLDIDDNSVDVMTNGCPHGHRGFITIGVRESDSDDERVSRSEYRELIDVNPVGAIHLARALLDYALDMIDDETDNETD